MMPSQPRNAVIAIRVSSDKQFQEGDSPEAQREQLEQLAQSLNARVVKVFIFAESGAKIIQPMQKAIDFCADKRNDVQLFLIKSIDRFTRGGADFYAPLKRQLDALDVSLVDKYGVISQQRVNTLEHLGVEYDWSNYSPSQKTEYLEAERAKDELRDILSRMIGAEVRYTRLGYWMRQTPYGFTSEKVETRNGKRVILKPHPTEAPLIQRMFELRARGLMHDKDIIDDLNARGFKTRIAYIRAKHDRTKIIGQRGGNPLDKDAFDLFLRNPIYAGVNNEKWTQGKPVRTVFDGLVSIDMFNAANRGKIVIIARGDDITIEKELSPKHQRTKGKYNPDFAFRKYVGCSICRSPLYGSSSRGGGGKKYPAYHCAKGHYFRVSKAEFEATIKEFMNSLSLPLETVERICELVMNGWERHRESVEADIRMIEQQIEELEGETVASVKKLKMVSSETAIRYMEEDLVKLEERIKALAVQKSEKEVPESMDIGFMMVKVKYFLEHLHELMIQQIDPIKRAQVFGLLFTKLPSYEEIKTGTENPSKITGVSELFKLADPSLPGLVAPTGLSPLAPPVRKGHEQARVSFPHYANQLVQFLDSKLSSK